MYGKLILVAAGVAVGYVLGARQGRQAYNRIKSRAEDVWRDPRVQKNVDKAQAVIRDKVPAVGDTVADAIDELKPEAS